MYAIGRRIRRGAAGLVRDCGRRFRAARTAATADMVPSAKIAAAALRKLQPLWPYRLRRQAPVPLRTVTVLDSQLICRRNASFFGRNDDRVCFHEQNTIRGPAQRTELQTLRSGRRVTQRNLCELRGISGSFKFRASAWAFCGCAREWLGACLTRA